MNEWTVEQLSTRNVWKLISGKQLITTSSRYSQMRVIADAHNSELTDERETSRYWKEQWVERGAKLLQAHEVLKRIRLRHSNNDSTTREIDHAMMEVKQ